MTYSCDNFLTRDWLVDDERREVQPDLADVAGARTYSGPRTTKTSSDPSSVLTIVPYLTLILRGVLRK